MAILKTSTLDIATGKLSCDVELSIQGNATLVQLSFSDSTLLTHAQEDGRPDWNVSDVLALCSQSCGFRVDPATAS